MLELKKQIQIEGIPEGKSIFWYFFVAKRRLIKQQEKLTAQHQRICSVSKVTFALQSIKGGKNVKNY